MIETETNYSDNMICDCPEQWLLSRGERCAGCFVGNKDGEQTTLYSFYPSKDIKKKIPQDEYARRYAKGLATKRSSFLLVRKDIELDVKETD